MGLLEARLRAHRIQGAPDSGDGPPARRIEKGKAAAVVSMEAAVPEEAGAEIAGPESSQPVEGELPALEDLVKRISPEVLATMDELFRAKWTGVRRVRPENLKNG
jgi:hypothetical protein